MAQRVKKRPLAESGESTLFCLGVGEWTPNSASGLRTVICCYNWTITTYNISLEVYFYYLYHCEKNIKKIILGLKNPKTLKYIKSKNRFFLMKLHVILVVAICQIFLQNHIYIIMLRFKICQDFGYLLSVVPKQLIPRNRFFINPYLLKQ